MTGHASGSIKIFDERVRNKIAVNVFESSNNYISQVKINPLNSVTFISSDYNGLIRTWDKRMNKNVFQIDAHD